MIDSVVLETFASGGPHGSLVPDLAEVVGAILARAPRPVRTSPAVAR